MAITITKPKAKTTAVQEVVLSPLASKIDELGSQEARLAVLETKIAETVKKELEGVVKVKARIKELKAEIEPLATTEFEDEPDKVQTVKGARYQAEFGKMGTEREVTDLKSIHDMLEAHEEGLFFKLASIALGHVDSYLTPEEKKEVLTTTRTKRGIKISKKA